MPQEKQNNSDEVIPLATVSHIFSGLSNAFRNDNPDTTKKLQNTRVFDGEYSIINYESGNHPLSTDRGYVSGYHRFKIAREGTMAFSETGPVDIIGFFSCGGCCGKKAVTRALMMVDRGVEAIVFASCMTKGNLISFACPHFAEIKSAVQKKLGAKTKIIDGTH
jgi:predicted metal-binding protein